MSGIFAMSFSSTQATFTVSPTLTEELGNYHIAIKVCLENYPTQCATSSVFGVTVTVPCTGITLALIDKSWTISSSTAFSYTLAFT
jgi:hypothetical protein